MIFKLTVHQIQQISLQKRHVSCNTLHVSAKWRYREAQVYKSTVFVVSAAVMEE